jgi:circadian clock protein KaiC
VSYLADTLITVRFFEAHGEVRQAISVLKKRSGHHEHTIREFQITDRGVRVGEPLHDFQGVLTGVPDYRGEKKPLFSRGGIVAGGT